MDADDTGDEPVQERRTNTRQDERFISSNFLFENGRMVTDTPIGRFFRSHPGNKKETPHVYSGKLNDRERSEILYHMKKGQTYGPILECEAIIHKKTAVQYVTIKVFDQEAGRDTYINACVGKRQFIELVDDPKIAAAKSKARARSRSRGRTGERTPKMKTLGPKKTEDPGFMFGKLRSVNYILAKE